MNQRTRIKLCGLTRIEDVQVAVATGADAIGLVFYPESPRYVRPEDAAAMLAIASPFVTSVGLFVNATPKQVAEVVEQVPLSLLQFHGDETLEQCRAAAEMANRPFIRAIRVKPDMTGADLLKYDQDYRAASTLFAGLLLDTWVDGYGGSGKVFDWSLIPKELAPRVVLSGGLSVQNVTDAVVRIRPYAVDVSSGIEFDKGIKDAAKMSAFVDAVRLADARSSR
ncbi:MAG: phosphoribosylanthranilate isomerase [Herminiimonas sp.]|nr:phosphoribosylanthranilate isomerase [Herminiimonas sp.]